MHQTVKVAWSGIFRWILLFLVGPLFGLAGWHATRFDPKRVTGMAFSSDGRDLLVFRGQDPKSRELHDATCTIQVWEVATGRLNRSQVTGHGKVECTANGELLLLDISLEGRIRVLSPQSFEPTIEWQLPTACGEISQVSSSDRLLIVNSITKNKTKHVTCLDLHNGRVAMQWAGSQVFSFLSRDGRRLFVSNLNATTKTWKTQAYGVDGVVVTPLPEMSFEGRTIRADSPAQSCVVERWIELDVPKFFMRWCERVQFRTRKGKVLFFEFPVILCTKTSSPCCLQPLELLLAFSCAFRWRSYFLVPSPLHLVAL